MNHADPATAAQPASPLGSADRVVQATRALSIGALLGLVLALFGLLVWLSGLYEEGQAQARLERDAAGTLLAPWPPNPATLRPTAPKPRRRSK